MGGCCCACNRASLILEDPSIIIKARVGDIGVGTARAARLKVQGACDGVMYVDGDTLRYMGFCVYSTKLQNVTNIEVVDEGYVVIGREQPLVLRPGLKISLQDGRMIAVAVPEAHAFAEMLRKVVPS